MSNVVREFRVVRSVLAKVLAERARRLSDKVRASLEHRLTMTRQPLQCLGITDVPQIPNRPDIIWGHRFHAWAGRHAVQKRACQIKIEQLLGILKSVEIGFS